MPYLEKKDQIAHIRDSPDFVLDLLFLHDTSDQVQVRKSDAGYKKKRIQLIIRGKREFTISGTM